MLGDGDARLDPGGLYGSGDALGTCLLAADLPLAEEQTFNPGWARDWHGSSGNFVSKQHIQGTDLYTRRLSLRYDK